MNIAHAEMVSRLMKPKADLQFTPEQADMIHAILGISGECGELLDAIKKHVIYGKPLDRENIVEELGDMEFYMEHLRALNGITREETIAANMAKLAKRYPGYEYTDAKAKERADKMPDASPSVGNGWRLLESGELLKEGDGFFCDGNWIDYPCRPDIFRGSKATDCPANDTAHTYPWRRKIDADKSDDGWIEWKGGECPVSGKVDCKLRDGYTISAYSSELLHWEHDSGSLPKDNEIIAYRLAK